MSFEEGALCEPLSVALQAAQRTGLSNNDGRIIIFGAGAVGLLVGAVAKSKGAFVTILGVLRQFLVLMKISTQHVLSLPKHTAQMRFINFPQLKAIHSWLQKEWPNNFSQLIRRLSLQISLLNVPGLLYVCNLRSMYSAYYSV